MAILAICPRCRKTISAERTPEITCPECGSTFGFSELQINKLIIDQRTEGAEMIEARKAFLKADYFSAREHFQRAFNANRNSYSAQYFVAISDVYLNENKPGYDVMGKIVETLRDTTATLSNVFMDVDDKLKFIIAMLTETKTVITRRLSGPAREDLFKKDIDKYRKVSIADLKTLLKLFKLDGEPFMTFSPEVAKTFVELADFGIKICYKTVQTVLVGDEFHSPNDDDYKTLTSLVNDFCFFGHSFDKSFDTREYSPDFSQNYALNDKVLNRLKRFDNNNKDHEKKHQIGDIDEYEDILKECDKALHFCYLNCYRSMCSRQIHRHSKLFFNGLEMIYRLLLPRVVAADKKRVEIRVPKYTDIVDYCNILTRFLVDAYELDKNIGVALHQFYEKLLTIVQTYYVPELEKLGKSANKLREIKNDEFYAYQKLLFDCACACVPALDKYVYVNFSEGTDKARAKLLKICQRATEDFLISCEFRIDELEQSNFYRPILHISSAVTEETEG